MFHVSVQRTNEGIHVNVGIDFEYEFLIKELPEGMILEEVIVEIMKRLVEKDIHESMGNK